MIPKQAPEHPLRAIAPLSIFPEPSIHPDHKEIDREVIDYLVRTWEWPSEKHKRGFVSWKLSDVVLFMFSTGDTYRVKLACELLLLGFLMDDWFDHHTLSQITAVVSRLDTLLASPATFTPRSNIEQMHFSLFTRILAVANTPYEPAILSTYMSMLSCHCDAARDTTTSLRKYLASREADVGMPICVELLYWTDSSLASTTPSERAVLRGLDRVASDHVSILNDVFSFEREWAASADDGAPLVNGVCILANEVGVEVGAAKLLCLALVRAWEVEFRRRAKEVLALAKAEGMDLVRMERAVKGVERRMSGAEAFSWRTRRYL
ncbi:isoprenoid synthase domain-containing protein [Podospora didyma]|uniref:Terpene synthase n=1 Tax=Podospora didyma TaxID=330526 RepID=A0AAE0K382_9PEZI|nr:isoprenoid synthase domain-containing protein [Podospora didyma]